MYQEKKEIQGFFLFFQLSLKSYYTWLTWHCLTRYLAFQEGLEKVGLVLCFLFFLGALLVGGWVLWGHRPLGHGVLPPTEENSSLAQGSIVSVVYFSSWAVSLSEFIFSIYLCTFSLSFSLYENVSFLRAQRWPVFFSVSWVFNTW